MAKCRYGSIVIPAVIVMALSLAVAGCGKKEAPGKSGETQVAEAPPEPSMAPITEERTYYGFEEDLQGWEVPAWAEGKSDYVAKKAVRSQDVASEGKSSMKIDADFPGGLWTAGLVEKACGTRQQSKVFTAAEDFGER